MERDHGTLQFKPTGEAIGSCPKWLLGKSINGPSLALNELLHETYDMCICNQSKGRVEPTKDRLVIYGTEMARLVYE